MFEGIAENAFNIEQFKDLPLTITLDGKKRVIGKVVGARIDKSRTGVFIEGAITDEEVAGILGAAASKFEAKVSPIGLSDAEIDEILEDPA